MRTLVRLGLFLGCVTATTTASAAPTDFSAGSWIIPMDVCYQPSRSFNGSLFSGTAETSSIYGSSCPDTSGTPKDGILKAYGLVYNLLANNVPVYYVLNSSKTAIDDVDMTLTSTTTPVGLVNHSTGALTEFMNAAHTSISYRGAPFIISAADVPAALTYLKSTVSTTDPRTGRSLFGDVYIHQAKNNILQAPVKAVLLQTPPKIALLDIGGAAIGVLQGYLKDAGLFTTGSTAVYPSIGTVFTQFQQPTDFTGGGLTAGGFSILWAPHWEGDVLSVGTRDGVMKSISDFVDNGHPFLAQCAALVTFEGGTANTGGYGGSSAPDTVYSHFMTTAGVNQMGLLTNQISQSSTFPQNGNQKIAVNTDPTVQAWIDPLTQIGDYSMNLNELSWTFDFTPASGKAWKTGVKSFVKTTSTNPVSYNDLDIETVTNKDNTSSKGLIIYLGGHSYGSQGSQCSPTCNTFNQFNVLGLERLVLNSLLFMGQISTSSEQTRSAPIVYSNGKTYLGTYVQQTTASASFPPWTGHFREYPSGGLSGTNVTSFSSITADWDSYNSIKTQSATDSRNIYTAVPISGKMTQIAFTTANLTSIQTNGGCNAANVTSANLTSIRKGLLGGIDHSIPAVIGPSSNSLAGSATRPVVAYVGALDGMLHAILVSGSVGSKSPGDELWAFIPPSQLCKVFAQSAGVDGSPNVGDAFVDTTGTGTKSWHTLLAVPDGGYAGGTLDVLDVTDPTGGSATNPKPTFVWEASDSFTSAGKTYVLGRAQGAAIAPISTASGVRFAYFVATDNTTGTAGNAFNMYALDAGNGSVIWRYNHLYTNDTSHNDVPGTVAVIDAAGDSGPVTQVYFGDVEGKVWAVGAAAGTPTNNVYDAASAHGNANSVNYPIESGLTLYRDPTTQHLDVLGVTGGADWVPATTLSYVFKYDTSSGTKTDVATLGTMVVNGVTVAERVYAVPTISGNQAYIITSYGQLQSSIGTAFTNTGNLTRINLGSTPGVTTLATVKQGASEVAVDGSGNVIAASATGITQNANSGRDTSQSVVSLQNATPKLTKVRAWLDWH